MRAATIAIFVAAFGVSSIGLSGSSSAGPAKAHQQAADSRSH
jgi:hypothetical protein